MLAVLLLKGGRITGIVPGAAAVEGTTEPTADAVVATTGVRGRICIS